MGNCSSNKKKRKIAECNDEANTDKDWIPIPKATNITNNSKLTILNRLTIQITNIGQLKQTMRSQHFSKYNILAVEPLDNRIIQELVTSPSVDIISLKGNTSFSAKDYNNAADKNIHFEILYAAMLTNSDIRQDILTLAHLFHIKGKSKNVILTSGTLTKLDIRNPHDVINLCFILGLSTKQAKESITTRCHSVILKSYGRKLGKTAINLIPKETT